jgi:uncharacterized RDD family membrane protein YckC
MIHDPSSIGRRLAAMLYESLVVFAILLVGFMFPQIVLSGFGINLSGKAMWLHLFLVLMAYFVWFWLNGGQTLPMKTWKLRLVDQQRIPHSPTAGHIALLLQHGQAFRCWASGFSGLCLIVTDSFFMTGSPAHRSLPNPHQRRSTHQIRTPAASRNNAEGAPALASGGQALITPRLEKSPFSA